MPLRTVLPRSLLLAVATLAAACGAPPVAQPLTTVTAAPRSPEPPGPIKHVIVVTIDGLVPDAYLHPEAHGLAVPTLKKLVLEGASSDGVRS